MNGNVECPQCGAHFEFQIDGSDTDEYESETIQTPPPSPGSRKQEEEKDVFRGSEGNPSQRRKTNFTAWSYVKRYTQPASELQNNGNGDKGN